MNPAFSTYLHFFRFFAAFIVFAHHASYDRFDGGWISGLSNYGHEAVVIFFVLSGYVITFTTDTKENTLSLYAASRLSRLWSVVLPALALTALFDWMGRAMHPVLYGNLGEGWFGYLASGLFFNQIWIANAQPGSNIPFWSLSYEFMYYLIFGAFVFFPRSRIVVIVCALLAGPKILLLFPAWLLGSVAYRWSKREMTRSRAIWFTGFGAFLALGLALPKLGNLYVTWRLGELLGEPLFGYMGHANAFISDNLIALGVALHLLGMAHLTRGVVLSRTLSRTVQKVADSTFCLYLLHYPALYFFAAMSVYATGELHGLAIGLASLAIGLLMTPPTEWLRRRSRQWFLLCTESRASIAPPTLQPANEIPLSSPSPAPKRDGAATKALTAEQPLK